MQIFNIFSKTTFKNTLKNKHSLYLINNNISQFSTTESCTKSGKTINYETNSSIPEILKHEKFTKRHNGPNDKDVKSMLDFIGTTSLDSLLKEVIPNSIILSKSEILGQREVLEGPISEKAGMDYLKEIASRNKVFTNYIGNGYHPTFVPPVVLRNVTENPAWYTSYTPYQAEISQGRLESLLNYQTLISELTGLPWANASLLDEATAAAEGMYIAYNFYNGKKTDFFLSHDTFPYVKDVVRTRAKFIGINLIEGSIDDIENFNNTNLCGALIQNPSNTGMVRDLTSVAKVLKSKNIIGILSADILSLMLVKSAGEMGFDVCIGSAQRFGVPMMNGGPHAGFMAVRDDLKRKMPGRVVGISKDSNGDPALRLSLQTREQHIKREKATSNICTAQALLANMSAFFAIFNGKAGLERIAKRVHLFAYLLDTEIQKLGYKTLHKSSAIFDTVVIDCSKSNINRDEFIANFEKSEINIRVINETLVSLSMNDTTSMTNFENLLSVFASSKNTKVELNFEKVHFDSSKKSLALNSELHRNSIFLEQDIFNKFSSETQVMRYINLLQKKDYSLMEGMIPLGSCTMKLNSAAELIPITWPEFANIHPFSPSNQMEGYSRLIFELTEQLKSLTQFDTVSLQPNSGANGEFAGLLAIRRYQESIGAGHRNIVIIPSSAHGTNPASATLCGLKVVVVNCDKDGNVDMKDLKTKVEKNKDHLSCIMITYPSTHGVFEPTIKEVTSMIYENGGQVYIDGANMNAMNMVTAPGVLGGDVCHLNLHKTFAIPHGGGGPGVGPICAKKHLEPFMPGHYEFTSKFLL